MKGVIVKLLCGGGCEDAYVDKSEEELYEGGVKPDTEIWCGVHNLTVSADDEGCEICLPVHCHHCGKVAIEENDR